MDQQGHLTPEQTTELVCEKAGQVLCCLQFCFSLFLCTTGFIMEMEQGDLNPGIKHIPLF